MVLPTTKEDSMDQDEMHRTAMARLRESADEWLIGEVAEAYREDRVFWESRDCGAVYALQIREGVGARAETPMLVFLDDWDFETGDSIYDL
jgi:hypothetical protein